jgi:hypothetical protein
MDVWRGCKSAECAEPDLRHRRRIFLRLGLIYVAAVAIGIGGVLTGREPKESLIGSADCPAVGLVPAEDGPQSEGPSA